MKTREERFVWDEGKALANERKHGIAFTLAATAFKDPLRAISHDKEHADSEDRWAVVGMAQDGLLVVVIYVTHDLEDGEHVRIISARRATSHERREYESGEYVIREPEMTDECNVTPAPGSKVDDDYDDGMKDEYDFSNAKRGVFKFCRFPIQIDNEVLGYFHTRSVRLGIDPTEAINEILRVHVGLPAKRTEPVETFRESLRRHFGESPGRAKSSRTPDTGAAGDDAERR
jgi:uncharacterized protein